MRDHVTITALARCLICLPTCLFLRAWPLRFFLGLFLFTCGLPALLLPYFSVTRLLVFSFPGRCRHYYVWLHSAFSSSSAFIDKP